LPVFFEWFLIEKTFLGWPYSFYLLLIEAEVTECGFIIFLFNLRVYPFGIFRLLATCFLSFPWCRESI
jgi:hypothetical protein